MSYYIMLEGGELASALGEKTLIKVDSAGYHGFHIADLKASGLNDKISALEALQTKSVDRQGAKYIPLAKAFAYKIIDDSTTTAGVPRVIQAAGMGVHTNATEQELIMGTVRCDGIGLQVSFVADYRVKYGVALDKEEGGVKKFVELTQSNLEAGQDANYPFSALVSTIYSEQPATK